jgi:hypothetical protein
MPCLLTLLALFVPRLVVFGLWLFTTWFAGAVDSVLWLVAGFVLAPTFLLWYSVVANVYGGDWSTWHIVVGIIAVLIDLSPASETSE